MDKTTKSDGQCYGTSVTLRCYFSVIRVFGKCTGGYGGLAQRGQPPPCAIFVCSSVKPAQEVR